MYKLEDRERLGSFWGRLETYCLKLAALYQLSLTTTTPAAFGANHEFFITPEALDFAIALVEHLKAQLVQLFCEELPATRMGQLQQKFLKIVRNAGGEISRRDLMRRASLSAADFNTVLGSLEADERLKVIS